MEDQNERLDSADDERIDLKELEKLGVDLVQRDLTPPRQIAPSTRQLLPQYNSVLISHSDEDLEEKKLAINKKSSLPEIHSDQKSVGHVSPSFMVGTPIKMRYRGKKMMQKDTRIKKSSLRRHLPTSHGAAVAGKLEAAPYQDELQPLQGQEM